MKKNYQNLFRLLALIFCVIFAQNSNAQTAPTTAPATPPTRNASDVISIYGGGDNSNSYANVAGVNYNPGWGQSTVESEVTIAGNKVLKYANFNYQGTDYSPDRDISGMQYLHFDIWTDNQSPNVYVITKNVGGANNPEKANAITSQSGSWKSVDIPINSTTVGTYLLRAYQFKFDGGNGGTMYLDNIYFYKIAAGTDANLSNLRANGTTVPGFASGTTSYTVTVPYGTTTVPTVTATTTDASATTVITPASTISGTTTVVVTSQDGTVTKTYTVGFQVAPPNTACAGTDTNTGFTSGYTYSFTTLTPTSVKVTFVMLDADKNTSNGDFQVDGGGFVGLARSGNTYTATLTGLTTGQTKTFKGHFVNGSGTYWAKTYSYVVGDDCQGPTGVTATQGVVTKTSVELLLNGTDTAGNVTYNVTGGGATQVTSASGVVKSVIFKNLTPNTPYTFNVVAKDIFLNAATSVPVSVTTSGPANTACIGTSDLDLGQGAFSTGYDYAFATDYNNNPTLSFTLLDTDRTVHSSSSLWRVNADDSNFQANVPGDVTINGKTVSVNLTGLAVGDTYRYAMKFVFNEGGMAVTKYFTYTVGENCGVVPVDMDVPTGITATLGVVTKNSIELLLNGTDNSGSVTYNVTGGGTAEVTNASGVQKSVVFKNLTPNTGYAFNVTAKDAAGNIALFNPAPVSTTTLVDTNTVCAGDSDEDLGQGTFSTGYSYAFATDYNNNPTISFTLLDTDRTVHSSSSLWRVNADDSNFQANVPGDVTINGKTVSVNLTGLAVGDTYRYAMKFVFNEGGMAVTKYFTYTVGENCGVVPVDMDKPVAITATLGAVTKSSVELLLNGTDNSGSVTYNVTGGATVEVVGTSGVQKSLIIKHLTPNTPYTFNVTAKDAAGNIALTNPAPVTVTTAVDTNTACAGDSDVDLGQGTFSTGYSYAFATDYNNNPTLTFTLLDTDRTVHSSSSLWRVNADDSNFQANVPGDVTINGKTVSVNLSGLAVGDTYRYAMKFVFNEGGMAVTKYFTYTVGENCGVVPVDMDKPTGITATLGAVTKNSIELLLNGTDNSGFVTYNVTGGATVEVTNASGVVKSIVFENLTPNTPYTFNVSAKDAAGNVALINPAAVSTTTLEDSDTDKPTAFTAIVGTITPTSVELKLKAKDNSNKVVYKVTYNGNSVTIIADSDVEKVVTLTNLTGSTDYGISIVATDEADNDMDTPIGLTARTQANTQLGIEDAELSKNAIRLYPNPVNNGIVTVEAGDLKVSKIEVYSILGAKVLETKQTAVSTDNLQAGVYFVKVYAEGKSITKKLIVN